MTKRTILQPGQSYSFGQYFEMTYEPEDILAEFGYTLQRAVLSLPQSTADLDRLDDLKSRIQESLPYIYPTKVSGDFMPHGTINYQPPNIQK